MFGNVNLIAIFTTGLLAGGLSCIVVQGGLLTATLAQREQEKLEAKAKNGKSLPILSFLIAKLIAYTILGLFLGWLGSRVALSATANLVLQFAVVVFMLVTALNLLQVHPIFRYFMIQPPHFLTRLIRQQSKRSDIFAPAILGAFTVFIPCGVTQAMMALAVASGSPVMGAAILFAFILGTSPLFFLLGYFTMRVGDFLKNRFTKVAAAALIILALFNFNNALALTGTPYTLSNIAKTVFCVISFCPDEMQGLVPVADQIIDITPNGYSPNVFAVSAGSQVSIHLINNNTTGCQQAFTIPALHLQKIVAPNQSEILTFIAPDKPQDISFMCSMGMYPGIMRVL